MDIRLLSLLIPLLLLIGGVIILFLTWISEDREVTVHSPSVLSFFSGIAVGWILYSIMILIMRQIALHYLGV